MGTIQISSGPAAVAGPGATAQSQQAPAQSTDMLKVVWAVFATAFAALALAFVLYVVYRRVWRGRGLWGLVVGKNATATSTEFDTDCLSSDFKLSSSSSSSNESCRNSICICNSAVVGADPGSGNNINAPSSSGSNSQKMPSLSPPSLDPIPAHKSCITRPDTTLTIDAPKSTRTSILGKISTASNMQSKMLTDDATTQAAHSIDFNSNMSSEIDANPLASLKSPPNHPNHDYQPPKHHPEHHAQPKRHRRTLALSRDADLGTGIASLSPDLIPTSSVIFCGHADANNQNTAPSDVRGNIAKKISTRTSHTSTFAASSADKIQLPTRIASLASRQRVSLPWPAFSPSSAAAARPTTFTAFLFGQFSPPVHPKTSDSGSGIGTPNSEVYSKHQHWPGLAATHMDARLMPGTPSTAASLSGAINPFAALYTPPSNSSGDSANASFRIPDELSMRPLATPPVPISPRQPNVQPTPYPSARLQHASNKTLPLSQDQARPPIPPPSKSHMIVTGSQKGRLTHNTQRAIISPTHAHPNTLFTTSSTLTDISSVQITVPPVRGESLAPKHVAAVGVAETSGASFVTVASAAQRVRIVTASIGSHHSIRPSIVFSPFDSRSPTTPSGGLAPTLAYVASSPTTGSPGNRAFEQPANRDRLSETNTCYEIINIRNSIHLDSADSESQPQTGSVAPSHARDVKSSTTSLSGMSIFSVDSDQDDPTSSLIGNGYFSDLPQTCSQEQTAFNPDSSQSRSLSQDLNASEVDGLSQSEPCSKPSTAGGIKRQGVDFTMDSRQPFLLAALQNATDDKNDVGGYISSSVLSPACINTTTRSNMPADDCEITVHISPPPPAVSMSTSGLVSPPYMQHATHTQTGITSFMPFPLKSAQVSTHSYARKHNMSLSSLPSRPGAPDPTMLSATQLHIHNAMMNLLSPADSRIADTSMS